MQAVSIRNKRMQDVPAVEIAELPEDMQTDYNTPAQFAREWNVSPGTVYRWIAAGNVSDVYRVGPTGYIRISKNARVTGARAAKP